MWLHRHEIGRVIQAVDDLGKLDNTLVIYIEATMAPARKAPRSARRLIWPRSKGKCSVEDQLKFYDVWGSSVTTPHMSWRGPGRSTRRSNGPSRWRRTSAAPGRHGDGMAHRIKEAGGIVPSSIT